MKKILLILLAVSLYLLQLTPAFSADELIYETFDNWKNPYVAEGWNTYTVGRLEGEYNQIYEAAQEMTCGPGESVYYRSIYRDFSVEGGRLYAVSFDYVVSHGPYGSPGPYAWLQFYDAQNRFLSNAGNAAVGFVPIRATGLPRGPSWVRNVASAPEGASRMRLVFQAPAQAPAGAPIVLAVRNVVLYEVRQTGVYEKIAGPFINRNTEFSQGINPQFGVYAFGTLAGEYKIRPWGGSSQGISSGGTFNDYKSIYRDLKVTPGQKYKLSVDVISNSTNESGTRTPSPVRIWVQYNGVIYGKEQILSTHGIDGTQAGIKDNEWTTVTVLGPGGTPYTIAPAGTDHARIILQVMGGTGGGTIFDNVSFTRYEN